MTTTLSPAAMSKHLGDSMKTQSLTAQFADRAASSDQPIVWARQACAKIGAWARACVDNYTAAGLYEPLSGFSDTELKHRGLSRDACARCLRLG